MRVSGIFFVVGLLFSFVMNGMRIVPMRYEEIIEYAEKSHQQSFEKIRQKYAQGRCEINERRREMNEEHARRKCEINKNHEQCMREINEKYQPEQTNIKQDIDKLNQEHEQHMRGLREEYEQETLRNKQDFEQSRRKNCRILGIEYEPVVLNKVDDQVEVDFRDECSKKEILLKELQGQLSAAINQFSSERAALCNAHEADKKVFTDKINQLGSECKKLQSRLEEAKKLKNESGVCTVSTSDWEHEKQLLLQDIESIKHERNMYKKNVDEWEQRLEEAKKEISEQEAPEWVKGINKVTLQRAQLRCVAITSCVWLSGILFIMCLVSENNRRAIFGSFLLFLSGVCTDKDLQKKATDGAIDLIFKG